jgi:hypothetical protein
MSRLSSKTTIGRQTQHERHDVPRSPDNADQHATFVSQIEIKHGPAGVLGRFFLLADTKLKEQGIHLRLEPISRLGEVNRDNRDSWAPIYPGLDTNYCELDSSNTLCFLGRDKHGDIVATQGARLYDLTGTTFADEAAALTPFYDHPHEFFAKGERCRVSAWAGALITGRAAYSGATWVRPDYRGHRLVEWLPRLSRAAATALWQPDVIFGFMAEPLVKRGLLKSNGFRNVEWSIDLTSPTIGDYRFVLLWMKPSDVIDDLSECLGNAVVSQVPQSKTA